MQFAKTEYVTVKVPSKLKDFTKHEFSSGSTTGKDYKQFSRLFKNHLKKILPAGIDIVTFSNNHYCFSGFLSDGKSFVYFSISDVRYFKNDWYNKILIRTAKHAKDYTGGQNYYTSLDNFVKSVAKVFFFKDHFFVVGV